MTGIKLKTDDCHVGDKLSKFRVRASVEFVFYAEVTAHDADEACVVAENACEEMGDEKWTEVAEHIHRTFESEQIVSGDGPDDAGSSRKA